MAKIVHYLFIWFILLSALVSCEKDQVGPATEDNPSDDTATNQDSTISGVLICNEGNFQWGNGSLSLYNPDSQNVQKKVFKNANDDQLGDVVQSMTIIDDKGYIVVNNSQKIEVVDMETMERITTINGLESPRYVLQVAPDKAYVSDLYAEKLAIIDLSSNAVTGHIPISGWTEEIAKVANSAYVTNMDSAAVHEINTKNDQVVDKIEVGVEPNSIVKAPNGKLWVLCSGGLTDNKEKPSLLTIDPETNKITQDLQFPDQQSSPGNLVVNRTENQFYYLDGDVYSMATNATSLPQASFISANDRVFYSLGVDSESNELYVADAKNYTEKGDVYRYSATGSLIDSFRAGIIPGHFSFHQ